MKPYPKYLDWLRYACAWFLYFYGISKLTGHQLTTPDWVAQRPIGSLDGYTLTWYYFGYSHAYKYILGLIQIVAASLFLFRKTALLAAVIMLPIMANILLINVFDVIAPGAEGVALFIFAALLLLVWHQRQAFYALLWSTQPSEQKSSNACTGRCGRLFCFTRWACWRLAPRASAHSTALQRPINVVMTEATSFSAS